MWTTSVAVVLSTPCKLRNSGLSSLLSGTQTVATDVVDKPRGFLYTRGTMLLRRFFVFLLVTAIFFPIAPPIHAGVWNQNRILSDSDLEQYRSMSVEEIQTFITVRGALGAYVTVDVDGKMKRAADIIGRVAESYRLNPRFLLALIQKEQGLVEDTSLTEAQLAWATGYAICDRCDKDHPELQEFMGFANQLEQAAKRFREMYLPALAADGKTQTGWGVGVEKRADGVRVKPENRATAALYTYTPHLAGNHLLWRIWQKWFSLRYPDGTLLTSDHSKEPTVYLIQGGLKRPIDSMSTLLSRFDPRKIIEIPKEELATYGEGAPIRYPDYSLVRTPRGVIYLTVQDTLRGFPSREIFRTLGFKDDDVINVTDEELASFVEGKPLSAASAYPQGALLQDSTTGGVYYVAETSKFPIWSKELLRSRFPVRQITRVSPEELEHYETGAPLRFNDGELVAATGNPTVYVISEGRRRPIASEYTFLAMGWQWQQIIWTSEKVLALHELGDSVSAEAQTEVNIVGL